MKSGILLVDKPEHLSSAAVVGKIKRRFHFEKIGHGGTLDPFASGLLVLLIGEATKVARFLLHGNKSYSCVGTVGLETDTGDTTGAPLAHEIPPIFPSLDAWLESAKKFRGKIQQVPPQYSAIKRDGRPLYEYARKGERVEVEARAVEIFSLDQISLSENLKSIRYQVTCSGGTYIRSLMTDWAKATGTCAHLQELRRTQSMQFSLDKAYTLAELLEWPEGSTPPTLIALEDALAHLPRVFCNEEEAKLVRMGRQEVLRQLNLPKKKEAESEDFFLLLESTQSQSVPLAILSDVQNLKIERVFDRSIYN